VTDRELQKLAKLIVNAKHRGRARFGMTEDLTKYFRYQNAAVTFWQNLVRNLKGDPVIPAISTESWREMLLDTAKKASKLKLPLYATHETPSQKT
jgi:hypothetical protein